MERSLTAHNSAVTNASLICHLVPKLQNRLSSVGKLISGYIHGLPCVHAGHRVVMCTCRTQSGHVHMQDTEWSCAHAGHRVVMCTCRTQSGHVHMQDTEWSCAHAGHRVVMCTCRTQSGHVHMQDTEWSCAHAGHRVVMLQLKCCGQENWMIQETKTAFVYP